MLQFVWYKIKFGTNYRFVPPLYKNKTKIFSSPEQKQKQNKKIWNSSTKTKQI